MHFDAFSQLKNSIEFLASLNARHFLVILRNKIKFHSTDIESLVSRVPYIYGVHVYILPEHPGLHLMDLLFFP